MDEKILNRLHDISVLDKKYRMDPCDVMVLHVFVALEDAYPKGIPTYEEMLEIILHKYYAPRTKK